MGYGEVGGGGSVQWQICHKKRKNGAPLQPPPMKTQQGEGVDPDVNDGDRMFVVINRGKLLALDANRVIVEVALKQKDDVQLLWGADIPAKLNQLADAKVAVEGLATSTYEGV